MKKQKLHFPSVMLCMLLIAYVPTLSGCAPQTGQEASQQQMTGRLDEIMDKSGGDWDKVSSEDKKYLIDQLSGGDAHSAEMLFKAKAGKLRRTGPPSGPPRAPGF